VHAGDRMDYYRMLPVKRESSATGNGCRASRIPKQQPAVLRYMNRFGFDARTVRNTKANFLSQDLDVSTESMAEIRYDELGTKKISSQSCAASEMLTESGISVATEVAPSATLKKRAVTFNEKVRVALVRFSSGDQTPSTPFEEDPSPNPNTLRNSK